MEFNIDRFFNQLRWDVFQSIRPLLIGASIIFGFQFLSTYLSIWSGSPIRDFQDGNFAMLLTWGGLIFTASIFKELKNTPSAQFYLMLPTSHLEKLISKLLITSIGFVILLLAAMTFFSYVNGFLYWMFTGNQVLYFQRLSASNLFNIKAYLVVQSIFLLGSIAFRTMPFLKTSFVLILLPILFLILLTIFLGFPFYNKTVLEQLFKYSITSDMDLGDAFETYFTVAKWLFWLLLAPIMWIAAYFKLTEKEL